MKSSCAWLGMLTVALAASLCNAQLSGYQVVSVDDGGTIRGSVKWQGPQPRLVPSEINKDNQVCDPDNVKKRDLERLVISTDGGVANTIVYLRNVTKGKAMDLPEVRRHLNQKNCRYEPHILLVPAQAELQVKSSDPLLHTVHMQGNADYNLPFTTQGQVITRNMTREGSVSLRCNAGHVWMNGEMLVVSHPYYTITDADGNFTLSQVPPGDYEIVAWHEGWRIVGESPMYDVMTQVRVKRPVFSDPVIWSKHVTVPAHSAAEVNFTLEQKKPQMPAGH
jgi:hypothetical protein